MARRLLPSTGSLGSVPPLPRYYSTLRIPSTRPAALRCLRLAVSRPHPRFAPLATGCAGQGPGVGHPVLPPGLAEKMKGPPRFPGDPRERALFSDPGGIACARPLRRHDAAFRHFQNVGSRDYETFRGSIARPAHSLSTLRSAGYPGTTQDSLPAAGQSLPGGAGYPQGPIERFPLVASPFPKLSWRTNPPFIIQEFQALAQSSLGRPRPLEALNDRPMIPLGRHLQGGPARPVLPVDVGPPVQEALHDRGPAVTRRAQ